MSLNSSRVWVNVSLLKGFLYLLLLTAVLSIPVYLASSPRRAQFNVCYMLVPSVIPFGLFLLDRLKAPRRLPLQFLLDFIVLGGAIARVFSSWPYMSGHSLFFSYAAVTTTHPLTRVVAAGAFIYTASWKIVHSDNLPELWTGVLYGLGFAFLYRLLLIKRAEQDAAISR